MKRAFYSLLFCAALVFAQSKMPAPAAAPRPAAAPAFTPTFAAPELHLEADNLSRVKAQLADYVRSGQYNRELAAVAKAAHDWVETRTAHPVPGEKLAAVFDIDETSLSNLPNMADCDFCSVAAQAKLYPADRLPAIPPVLDLYNFAKSKGIAMIFLTGRYDTAREATAANLHAVGYNAWEDLLFRPTGNTEPARIMKAAVRAGVERKGYKIVLSIGDQLSDLSGGAAERTFKLPNPFYFVE